MASGRFGLFITTLLTLALLSSASASYGIFVGKNLTLDGSTFIGGSGDEVSSHWLEIVPRTQHPEGATVSVGVTADANMPGELIEIPQVAETNKYITMNYSDYEGFPPPLTNGGLNEHGVAARDIWSPSRSELVEMTPNPQTGPQYSDLSRIAMERATTAREAVEIVGELIDEHGYSTYGGNSHMFADANEGWVLINFAGGQGLWAAERLGPDDVRVSYPGYILDFPVDFENDPDFMASDNFIDFAVEQGWYDPESGEPFNVNTIYGNGQGRADTVAQFEERMRALAPDVTLEDMMAAVRDPILAKDTTGYGQVAHLKQEEDVPNDDLRILWVAPTGSVTAPFIPYRIGVESVAPEYGRHRYLTKDQASTFVTEDWQIQEATRFAGREFKRLMYYTCDRPEEFLPEVTKALTAFEAGMIAQQGEVEATAVALYEAGEGDLAREYLNDYSYERAMDGLDLGMALADSIEARTQVQYGLRAPEGDVLSELDYAAVTCRTE